jgi:hypothetical protein
MFGRIHHLLAAAVGVVGVLGVTPAWAGAGYLPQAGPLALRFRVPPAPAAEHLNPPVAPPVPAPIALPPQPMASTPPETSNAASANMLKPVVALTNAPALEYNAREPLTTAVTDSVISPQMLIKYFTASPKTAPNANGAGVVTPVGFTPPPVTTPAPTPTPPPTKGAPTSPP